MMSMRCGIGPAVAAATVLVGAIGVRSHAEMVLVELRGIVEFNQVEAPPVGELSAGTEVSLSFLLDSDVFVDSADYPTRGYVIDSSTFALTGGETSIGLASPYPAGATPFFVLRDNDPAVDGFFIADSVDFPIGVDLDADGIFGTFSQDFGVSYVGDTLGSLDLLDAVGTYGFDGLKGFNWTIDDGPFSPVSILFDSLEISVVPAPATLIVGGVWSLLTRSRRRGASAA